MGKLNYSIVNNLKHSNKDIKEIQRPQIKKNQKSNHRSTSGNITVSSKCQSISNIFLAQGTPKKVALNKSLLIEKIDQKIIDHQFGPSLHELIQLGLKFSEKEIFGIGLRLIHTIRFLHNNNKVSGGIFPKSLYFSKNLQQFYLGDLSRCEDIDFSNQSIKFYEKNASSNFLQDAILYGAQNLKQNIIPFPRDQIQNILYVLYYLECNLHGKKYKKTEIINSTNFKELYLSLKSFKFNQKYLAQPIITYFAAKAKSLEINDLFFQKIQIEKLMDFLIQNPHRSESFSIVTQNLNRQENNLQKVKQENQQMINQLIEDLKTKSYAVNSREPQYFL